MINAEHLKENIREEDEHPIGIYRAQRPKAARIYSVNDFFFLSKAEKLFANVLVIMDIPGTIADTSEIIGG